MPNHNVPEFVRVADGKVFVLNGELLHWTDIVAEDGTKDSVKWIGSNLYAGSGHTYRIVVRKPL